MLRSPPSAIDDALGTLYDPNAVFSQFLGSASMAFFPFLSLLPLLVFSCLFYYFVSFSLSFLCFIFLVFSIDLSLPCVCA